MFYLISNIFIAINNRRGIQYKISFCLSIKMDETLAYVVWPRNVPNGRYLQNLQVVHVQYFIPSLPPIIAACIPIVWAPVAHKPFLKFFRYALPLFFLCVRSNVGYIVVAVFIPENEDADSISEVLRIIRSENPTWDPENMMVDCSLAEISAINECFPSMLNSCSKFK